MSNDALDIIRKLSHKKDFWLIGKKVQKLESLDAVLGQIKYVADLRMDDMVYVKPVLSKHPHANIKRIDTKRAERKAGVVTVVTANDVRGKVEVFGGDQPVLAYNKARYMGDVLALVAAEEIHLAEDALEYVDIDYEPLPAITNPLDALSPEAPKIHDRGNLLEDLSLKKGDVKEGFGKSDVIVENEYSTQRQEHGYLEPEAALAIPLSNGGVTIISGTHWPFLARAAISGILGLEAEKIRFIVGNMGGSFGGKDGIAIGARAAITALKTKRPALLVHTRFEDIIITEKRHPYIIKNKVGASFDGKLLAMENDIISDTGAYAETAVFVARRSLVHSCGPYIIPNVYSRLRIVYTNNSVSASMRGFGGPQVHFAVESQIDELAWHLKIDPVKLRLKNILLPGTQTITNQTLDSVGAEDTLKVARNRSHWFAKRAKYQRQKGLKRKGIGVATVYHGTSIGVEGPDYSSIKIAFQDDGTVLVHTGHVDFGQGSKTAIAMIVAEILGLPLQSIHIDVTDTSTCLDSNLTSGSRGTTMGGNAAIIAALKLKEKITQVACILLKCQKDEVETANGLVWVKRKPSKSVKYSELFAECKRRELELKEEEWFHSPVQIEKTWNSDTLMGDAYLSFAFATYIAEVEVDVETGKTSIIKLIGVHDSGKIINPQGAETVVQGGMIQALGMAVMEEITHKNGEILNPNFSEYYMPTAKDCPLRMENIFVEHRSNLGPFGAKGLAEVPMNAVAPAIANAIFQAVNVRVKSLPITSEKIFLGLMNKKY